MYNYTGNFTLEGNWTTVPRFNDLSLWDKIKMKLLAAGGTISLIGGVIGCILGIIVIYRNRNKKRFAFLAICCSLLVSCLLYKTLSLTFQFPTWYHKRGWIFGNAMCKISMFMMHLNQGSITYHFILLSIYVIICIRNPNQSRKMDQRRVTYIILGVLWLALIAINAEHLAAYQEYSYTNKNNRFRSFCYPNRDSQLAHVIINTLFFFLVPFIMLFILSIIVCVSARKRRNNRYIDMDNEDERHLQEFVVITVSLTVLHFIVVLPLIIYNSVGTWRRPQVLYILADIQMFIASFYPAIIPYIILLSVKDFKTTLRQMFCCKVTSKDELKVEDDPNYNNIVNGECLT